MVKMKNLLNGNTWLWERGKFMNRRYLIQELYQKFLDGEDVSRIPKEEDPFWEPTEDVLIGTANVFLQSLAYALDFDDNLMITDYKGVEEGHLKVEIMPCTEKGSPLDDDSFVEDPKDLLNKVFRFKVVLHSANIHKARFSKGIFVKYTVINNGKSEEVKTPMMKNTLSPEFKHSKIVTIPKMKQDHIDFFESGCFTFSVYGLQEDSMPDPKLKKLTTKELRQMDNMEHPQASSSGRRATIFSNEVASDQSHLKTEIVLLQRKYERLASKERRMQQLCEEWSNKPSSEQQYEPFFRAVSAVANSTGTKLKTTVHLLNQMLKFQKLTQTKRNDDTMLNMTKSREPEKLSRQKTMDPSVMTRTSDKKAANGAGRRINSAGGNNKEGSSTCSIQ